MPLLLYKLCLFTAVSRDVEFYLIQDSTAAAIYCFFRGFSGEIIAAGDTRHAYTVDADHPTRTLTLTRTLWGDLCLDAGWVPRVVCMEKSVVSLLSVSTCVEG